MAQERAGFPDTVHKCSSYETVRFTQLVRLCGQGPLAPDSMTTVSVLGTSILA